MNKSEIYALIQMKYWSVLIISFHLSLQMKQLSYVEEREMLLEKWNV